MPIDQVSLDKNGADAVFDKSNELEAFFEYCSSLRSE